MNECPEIKWIYIHDRGEAQPISSDNGFETMFKRLSMTFSPEKMSRVED